VNSARSPAGARLTRRDLGRAALAAWLAAGGAKQSATGSTAVGAEVPRWRADFPALEQTVNGEPLAYLDSAATTQRPLAVIAALENYYRNDNANPGGALHALARRAFS
jgi:hypothetical protein